MAIKPIHPDLAARAYYKAVHPYIVAIHRITNSYVLPVVDLARIQTDADNNTNYQREKFAREMAKAKVAVDKLPTKSISKAATQDYTATTRLAQSNATRQLPTVKPKVHPDPKHKAQFIQANVELITSIPDRHFAALGKLIDKATENNVSPEVLTRQILDRVYVSESQARLIATDQTQKLHSELCNQAYIDAGVTKGTWQTSEDEKVRESHNAVNGKKYNLDEGILVDGEQTLPGQPIQCFPGNTLVESLGRTVKLYRRWFRGEAVEVVTALGETFRCTNNHPILTDSGWKAANALDLTDKIVQVPGQIFNPPGLTPISDVYDTQTTIVQAFDAFAEAFGVSVVQALPLGGFHGDAAANDKVDIIDIDRHLALYGKPSIDQSILKDFLSSTNPTALPLGGFHLVFSRDLLASNGIMRSLCKLLSFVGSHLGMADQHTLATSSWLESVFDGLSANDTPGTQEVFRHLLLTHPTQEECLKLLFRELYLLVESPTDSHISTYTSRVGISSITTIHLDEHVYNLQTTSDAYAISHSRLIVHNCRCFCIPVLTKATKTKETKELKAQKQEPKAPKQPIQPETPKEPVEKTWGAALQFPKSDIPQAEVIAKDLQTITEASPKIVQTLVTKGATLNIDLASKSVSDVIRYSKRLRKDFGHVADQLVGGDRVITGIVVGEKHLVIASGGGHGVESLMGHEFGHVIDFQASRAIISNTVSWRAKWKEWTKRPAPADAPWGHEQLTDPVNGPRETFAEIYGQLITRGKANTVSRWGSAMVDEMVSTLRGIDPQIKIGE